MSTHARTPRARRLLAAAALLLSAALAPRVTRAQGSGFVVIVNASNATTVLPRAEVSRLFLKQVPRWPDGNPVIAVDLADRSPTRFAFSKAVHGRTTNAVKTYWQQQVFSGRGVPPSERDTDADVVAFVREVPNAIGYVSSDAALGPGVKPVTVIVR